MQNILSRDEIEQSIKCYIKSGKMDSLYKEHYVVSNNTTKDTKERYCDVVCECLLKNMEALTGNGAFDIIDRGVTGKSYNMTKVHSGKVQNTTSGRDEEHTAMQMKDKDYDFIGSVLDYQIPLKSKQMDTGGKIDIMSLQGRVLRLIELKKPASRETLLRCVLESYTYFRKIHKENLVKDFHLGKDTIVIPAVLVGRSSHQVKEYMDDTSKTLYLMRKLGIEIFDYFVNAEKQVTNVSQPWLNKNNYL